MHWGLSNMKNKTTYWTSNSCHIHFNLISKERTAFSATIQPTRNEKTDLKTEIKEFTQSLCQFLAEQEDKKQEILWIRFYTILSEITFLDIQSILTEKGIDCAVSLIRQQPLSPSCPISIQGLALSQGKKPTLPLPIKTLGQIFPESSINSWIEGGNEYILLTHLVAMNRGNSETETTEIFEKTQQILDEMGFTLPQQGLRTWLYIKDIDDNYEGLVVARRDYFKKIGLTERFLVSTGIGNFGSDDNIVTLDLLLCREHSSAKNIFIDAPDFMPHANSYGVTFERALLYKNSLMDHILVAGTASIDTEGEILYESDPPAQIERIFLILQDLLRQGDLQLEDFEVLTIYLRDDSQLEAVVQVCQKILPDMPKLFLHGPVCRPGWLVEIEGEGSLIK